MSDVGKESKKHTTLSCKIKACMCKNEYQDLKYGKALRVHNPCAKGWRCTVCGKEGM